MKYIKENYKFLIFLFISAIVSAVFVTFYTLSTLSEEMINEAIAKVGSKGIVIAVTILEVVIFSLILGVLGLILSNKVGLWKKFTITKESIIVTSVLAVACGVVFILVDYFVFGSLIDPVKESYLTKPTFLYIASSYTYGGVIEEVMLRLFFMSLVTFVIYKVFFKNKETKPAYVYIIANAISALTFALLHLPSTYLLFGSLSFIIVLRCIVMNGVFGMVFGYLYKKYGIGFAMIAHFGTHLVMQLIWILFI